MKYVFLASLVIGSLVPVFAWAHPGRTDVYGCHTCRTNCASWGLSYGEYHCHNAKTLPQPKEPIKSTYGENGTGYTQPAPEYKKPQAIITPPSTLPKALSIEERLKQDVLAQRAAYNKNPHLFRERLIKGLETKFGINSEIGRQVYTLLPDKQ